MSHAGHRFMPPLDGRTFGSSLRVFEWRLAPGMAIVPVMADLAESEYDPRFPGDEYWTTVYEVHDGEHVATAASLEAALAVLHERYLASLPF